jgi:hypothetical protein
MRQIIHCPRCGFTTNHKGNLFKHFHKKKLCKPKFVKASRRQMTEEFDQYQERYLEHISGTRNIMGFKFKSIKNKIKLIPKQKIISKSTMIIYDKIDNIDEEIEHPDETECKKLLSSLMMDLIDINVSTLYDYIKIQPIDKIKHNKVINILIWKKFIDNKKLIIPDKIQIIPDEIPITPDKIPNKIPIIPDKISNKTPDKILITSQQSKTKKYIKKHISKALRSKVWDLYIGKEKGISKCVCCNHTEINSKHFECGHIIAESNNGGSDITNLRPICSLCNKSMGKKNMFNFMLNNGFVIKNPVMICD